MTVVPVTGCELSGVEISFYPNSYHLLVLLLLKYGHKKGRDYTPLDVQDGGGLILLREKFHLILSLNHDLQGVSGK